MSNPFIEALPSPTGHDFDLLFSNYLDAWMAKNRNAADVARPLPEWIGMTGIGKSNMYSNVIFLRWPLVINRTKRAA
ncbi:hypothetical protein AB4Y45_24510 [Paraburkholderia sp. EG287A]|uniref:hypothetical protein n=1 Tax=unclassified Paraburkholderia TaxID=2615204 RepID=UPI0034D16CF9